MALLKFKRSAVPAKVPALNDLALGELAINTYDGKVYTKKDDGTPAIVEIGGNSSGITTITSTDGSVTVTGSGATRDLSVAVAGSTTNVLALVRNNTGATLAKGTVVYINGSLGQNSTVAKAIATSDATSAQTLGLMTANLANNATGYVTIIGLLTNMDTSAFSDGQQLYLSPTTAGTFTTTKPYAPNHIVYVAVVEHAHPTQGKLFVKVQNGYEMDELHDVSAQNPANNDGLFYNTTSGLWEKKSIATALGYTPANKAGDTFTGVVSIQSSNDAQLYLNGNGTSWAGISWADVSGTDYMWYNGSTSTFAIGGGGSFVANKKLHVHGGMTIGSGIAASASGTNSLLVEASITANQIYGQIFYDSQNGAYYVDPASSSNLYSATVNSVLVLPAAAGTNSFFVGTGDGASLSTYNFGLSGWNGMAFYNPTTGGAFPNATTGFLAFRDGYIEMRGSLRAPIFYDSNDTAYYINGAGDSVLNTLYMRNGTVQAKFAQASNFGYSSSYKTVVLGNEYLTTISMGVDVSGNASGSFNGQGEGREVLFRNGVAFITPNAANTAYETPLTLLNGYATSIGSFRAPIFYDSDNTGYYIDAASTSVLGGIVLNGALDVRDSNPQYWRSTNGAYQRVDTRTEATSLSRAHWYGVSSSGGTSNFRHAWYDNAAYFNVTAQDGEIIFERTAGETIVRSTGSFRAPIFYDSNNTGYYIDPNSTSRTGMINADNLRTQNNVYTDQQYGSSIVGAYSAYRYQGVYAMGDAYKLAIDGTSAGSLYGICWSHPYAGGVAANLNTHGALVLENGAFLAAISGSIRSRDDMRSPIFYDSNDTGYYIDPNSTGLSLRVNGNIECYARSAAWAEGYRVRVPSRATWGGIRFTRDEGNANGNWAIGFTGIDSTDDLTFWGCLNGAEGMRARLTQTGNFSITNAMVSYSYQGNGNVGGTGSASWHPSGIYSAGYNWLYGGISAGGGDITSVNAVYANAYYDSGNTGYYVDPASTSNLNVLNVIGGNVVKGDSSQGRSTNSGDMNSLSDPSGFYYAVGPTGAPNAEWYNWINCIGNAWGGTDRYGFQIAHQFWNEDQLYVRRVQSGGWQTWRRIFTEGSVDVRAPIFYDRDNTAFYLDANSTGTSLNVAGSIIAAGNVTAYSDIRVKANVETIPSALDKLDHIRGVTYTRTDLDDKEQRYAGVIAQEIQAVLPEAVRDLGNIKAVDYNATIALLIEAVKELSLKVKTLEEKDN
jgi:hypothetical protein